MRFQRLSLLALNAITAGVYYTLARAVGFLSLEPIGVVPFWPAAGFAAAMTIRFGWKPLAGIWLGAALHELQSLGEMEGLGAVARAVAPAVGACIQAAAAAWLVNRHIGRRAKLDDGPQILRFLLHTGPVCCLISPTVTTLSLFALGGFADTEVLRTWVPLWFGDILGVAVLAPLVHLLLLPGVWNHRVRVAGVSIPAIATILAVVLVFLDLRERELTDVERDFDRYTASLSRNLESRLQSCETVLDALVALYRAQPVVTREQFAEFTEILLEDVPGVSALAWAPLVRPAEAEELREQAILEDGLLDFAWKIRSGADVIQSDTPGDGPVIYYIEPIDKNRTALGYAISGTPAADIAWKAARDRGRPVTTTPFPLVQDREAQQGLVCYAPVYENDSVPETSEERYESFIGCVSIALRGKSFLESAIPPEEGSWMSVKFAVTVRGYEPQIIGTIGDPSQAISSFEYISDSIQFGEREVQLFFRPTRDFFYGRAPGEASFTLQMGMSFIALLTGFLLLVTGHADRLSQQVRERTAALEKEVHIRRRAEASSEDARIAAERASSAKGHFLATMSHEIRTPINAIVGMSDLLADTELSAEQRESVDIVHKAGTGLLALVSDILDLSKIEAGRLELKLQPFSPAHLGEEVPAYFRRRIAEEGLELRTRISPDLPSLVVGDGTRLRQVFIILVDNAIKYTDEGAISFELSCAKRDDDRIMVECVVSDTGNGISKEDREALFRPFVQLEVQKRRSGVGLGLSICQEIVRLMEGTITVESELGRGSQFTVHVPFGIAPEMTSAARFDEASTKFSFHDYSFLVVEDNPINRKVAERMLTRLGAEDIDFAETGEEGVKKGLSRQYDVILMDCDLPGIDGLEATRQIRKEEAAADACRRIIIALTAHALEGDRDRCLQAGMDDYMPKPITMALLKATTAQLLMERSVNASRATES